MLPPEAKTYFDTLWSSASTDAAADLSNKREEFARTSSVKGHGPGGAGYAARLSRLYKESLSSQATAIVDVLKKVHMSFNSPLGEGVDAQLKVWGARALSGAYQGLEGAYTRHLQRFGLHTIHASGLDHVYTLAQATVANVPSNYLWELRNVPVMRAQQSAVAVPAQVTIHNSGTIGSLQTGSGSTANVQQKWVQGDTSELRVALGVLREVLARAPEVEAEVRRDLVADLDSAYEELQQERPHKGQLLRWLGGIGAVVGTIGSIQPAYEAVRSVARMLGLPL